MRHRVTVAIAVMTIFAAACGGGEGASTTAPDATTTTGVADSATSDETTTTVGETTTTAAETTTTAAATTTAAPPTPADAQAIVDAKTAAVAAAAPAGWTVEEQANDSFDEADFTYEPCLGIDDFDLDDLDAATVAVKEVQVSAPAGAIPFASTAATIESRVFDSEATAADVFSVIERLYGSDEGRQCMSAIVTELITDAGDGTELDVTVEAIEVDGADVGARTLMSATIEGFDLVMTIDLVAHRDGACTVVATFISFGDEFPADIADELFSSAASV
jgi:hypothetical protein